MFDGRYNRGASLCGRDGPGRGAVAVLAPRRSCVDEREDADGSRVGAVAVFSRKEVAVGRVLVAALVPPRVRPRVGFPDARAVVPFVALPAPVPGPITALCIRRALTVS
jgi:hypothetical protein